MTLAESTTKENLMRAFAGESQARNRYTFAAELAEKNGLYVIKEVFDLTARQECQHAQIFYKYLKDLDGEEITVDGGYPVNMAEDVETQLLHALHNEGKEADEVYRAFGDKALEEGFNHISGKFYMIADVEKMHQQRFEAFYQLLKEGKLFVSDVKTGWMCLKCGYVLESTNAPQNCPVCDADMGYFVRLSMSPYEVGHLGEEKRRDLGK